MVVHAPAAADEYLSPWGWPDEAASWSWAGSEGSHLTVRVFAKGCSEATLRINNVTIATVPFAPNFTAVAAVPYAAGTLEARATCADQSRSASLATAGPPAALRLAADRANISHSPAALAYVTATLLDAEGVRVPASGVRLNFSVAGVGRLIATGSGDPADSSSFVAPARATWQGRATAVLQPAGDAAGRITLTARAPALPPASITVDTY